MNHYRVPTPPPYRYRSDGPWSLCATERSSGQPLEFTRFDTLFEAVAAFDRFHLPPCSDRTVGLGDTHMQLLLYYECSPDGIETFWGGTGEGFDLLELIHENPEDVVLWAATARGEFSDVLIEP